MTTHPDDDSLLLHVYGELPPAAGAGTDAHLRTCGECRARFQALAEPAAALEWTRGRRSWARPPLWLGTGLAAAIAAVALWPRPVAPDREPWQSHVVASPAAGYVAGGTALMTIDSQLVWLERGRRYDARLD